MPKAIFWDNDGVLVDSEELYYEANRAVLAKAGVDFGRKDYAEISLQRGESVLALAAAKGLSDEDVRRLRDERNAIYAGLLADEVEPRPGIGACLTAMRMRDVKMGVVTTSLRAHFDAIHARTGFRDYFDFVLTREDVVRAKPDPEPYRKALELSGVDRKDCLVVEDSERGVRSARAAGLDVVVVPSSWTVEGRYDGCTVLENLGDLEKLLVAWAAR